jgi:hypothetical protein
LARIDGEQRRAVQRPARGNERGGGDHGVGLQLANGLRELRGVDGGPDDTGATGAIEEVHDFLGNVRRLEREHDPRDLVHPRSTSRGKHRSTE